MFDKKETMFDRWVACIDSLVESPDFTKEQAQLLASKLGSWQVAIVKQGVVAANGTKKERQINLLRIVAAWPKITIRELIQFTGFSELKILKTLNLDRLDTRVNPTDEPAGRMWLLTKIPAHKQYDFYNLYRILPTDAFQAKAVAAAKAR